MKSIDYLPNTNFQIVQDDMMFRINTDTEVLGQFLKCYKKDLVYDFGCNNGALMLYASLFNPKKIVGIDINKEALVLAKENLDFNHVTNYELIHADIKELKLEEADTIICNPPYFKTEMDNLSANDYKNIAKHEVMIDLETLVKSIARNLRDNGNLYFLFLTSRLEEVISTFKKYHLGIKEMQFIYDENKEFSFVFMIHAKKNMNPNIHVLKPIIIKR